MKQKNIKMYKHKRTWLGSGLSVLCLGLILWYIDPKQIWMAFSTADWRVWPLVIIAYTVFMLLRAWRWQIMLGDQARYWPVFHAQSIGYLLSNIMPFRIGDLGRAYLIGQQPGLNGLQALSTVALERVLDMLVVVLLFTMTMPFVPIIPPLISRAGLIFGVLAVGGFGVLLAAVSQRTRALKLAVWALSKIPRIETEVWLNRVDLFLSGFQALTRWSLRLQVLGLSIAIWLAAVVTYYWGIGAFWPGVTWSASVFTLCVAAFGLSIPSSPSGLGVFHGSIWLALPIFSVAENQALGFAFAYHAITLVIVLMLGGIGLWQSGQTLGNISKATQRFVARLQSTEAIV